jgi:transposase InsO family protein
MAEAFVKTFKRDYVYVHDRPDAKTVMSQLDQWFEDYNEYPQPKRCQSNSAWIAACRLGACRF